MSFSGGRKTHPELLIIANLLLKKGSLSPNPQPGSISTQKRPEIPKWRSQGEKLQLLSLLFARPLQNKDPLRLCNSLPTPRPSYFSSKPKHLEQRVLSEQSKTAFITPKGRCCRNIKNQQRFLREFISFLRSQQSRYESLQVSLFIFAKITLLVDESMHLSATQNIS